MYDNFEVPDAAPDAKQGGFSDSPITTQIEFKGGKSQPASTAAKLTPGDLGVKFCHYKRAQSEGEHGVLEDLPSLTFYALGLFSRFSGTEFNPDKPKDSDRYTSTLYRDQADRMYFRKDYVKQIRENPAYSHAWTVGTYREVRAFADRQDYRNAVGYKRILVAYCTQLQEVVEFQVSRTIEFGLAAAIAKATGTPHNTRRIGGMMDLSTQFWGFHFAGDYAQVQEVKGKECQLFAGIGEWRVAPLFRCGVIKSTAAAPDQVALFSLLVEKQMEVDAYVDSQIEWANTLAGVAPGQEATQAPTMPNYQKQYEAFSSPVVAPPMNNNNPALTAPMPMEEPVGGGDDLPF